MLTSENKLKKQKKRKARPQPVKPINGPTSSWIRSGGAAACIRASGTAALDPPPGVLPLDLLRGRGRLPTPAGATDPGSAAARSVECVVPPTGAPATRPSLPCAERGVGEMREMRVRRES